MTLTVIVLIINSLGGKISVKEVATLQNPRSRLRSSEIETSSGTKVSKTNERSAVTTSTRFFDGGIVPLLLKKCLVYVDPCPVHRCLSLVRVCVQFWTCQCGLRPQFASYVHRSDFVMNPGLALTRLGILAIFVRKPVTI